MAHLPFGTSPAGSISRFPFDVPPHIIRQHGAGSSAGVSYHTQAQNETTDGCTIVDPRSPIRDENNRGSFSSVREDEFGDQTFTHSRTSAFSYAIENAVFDSPAPSKTNSPALTPTRDAFRLASPMSPTRGVHVRKSSVDDSALSFTSSMGSTPLTLNESRRDLLQAPHVWQPVDTFIGWNENEPHRLKGKYVGRSFSDLQLLNAMWANSAEMPTAKEATVKLGAGKSRLEELPVELLGAIIDLLYLETPTNGLTKRNADLIALLRTSHTLHVQTLHTLYRKITIPHSKIFRKFLTAIQKEPDLGLIVQRLDFNHFNPNMLFSTGGERSQAQNLTKHTLLECLELTPNLREFLAQEHIVEDLSADVIMKLFYGLERIQAIDFAGCSGRIFKSVWDELMDAPERWQQPTNVRRLSFHKCMILPAIVYETIFPTLQRLTHLDVSGCRVTDKALLSIPHTARITHLNLAKCGSLSAEAVLEFIGTHPSVRESLVVLNVATDATSHQMFDDVQVSRLLNILPPTLKSLSLKGAQMNPHHLEQLRPIVTRLEELGIGRGLNMSEICSLICPERPRSEDDEIVLPIEHTLRYLDVSDLLMTSDLDYLFDKYCLILDGPSEPLQVLEISENVAKRMCASAKAVASHGWGITDEGARYWLVRKNEGQTKSQRHEEAYRWWKMGATYWGTRKIPVADCEVGGMYGSFMFARKV